MATHYVDGNKTITLSTNSWGPGVPAVGTVITDLTDGGTLFITSITDGVAVTGWAYGTFGNLNTLSDGTNTATCFTDSANDGSSVANAISGPHGLQELIDNASNPFSSIDTVWIWDDFDLATYGKAVDFDGYSGDYVTQGEVRFIACDASQNPLPLGSHVVFDGGGTLNDDICTMGGTAYGMRFFGFRFTGTTKAGSNAGFANRNTTENRGITFIGCKFDDCQLTIDMDTDGGTPRHVAFVLCEFIAETGTYGGIFDIYGDNLLLCNKFTSNGSGSYLLDTSTVGRHAIIGNVADGNNNYQAFIDSSTGMVIHSNIFHGFTTFCCGNNSYAIPVAAWNNICEVQTPTGDRAIFVGLKVFQAANISNSTLADLNQVETAELPVGGVQRSHAGETISINDAFNAILDLAKQFNGLPDWFGTPSKIGAEVYDLRQAQGLGQR